MSLNEDMTYIDADTEYSTDKGLTYKKLEYLIPNLLLPQIPIKKLIEADIPPVIVIISQPSFIID